MGEPMEKQIKTKQRVIDYGEVYTAKKQVEAMMNLLPPTLSLETTYLEPACGNGNFLVEILKRKLNKVSISKNAVQDFFISVSSIYGVDIQMDNILEARARLYEMLMIKHGQLTGTMPSRAVSQTFQRILERNIQCGDTLAKTDSAGKPLMFCEWKLRRSGYIICKEYRYSDILAADGDCHNCIAKHRYTWLVQVMKRAVA